MAGGLLTYILSRIGVGNPKFILEPDIGQGLRPWQVNQDKFLYYDIFVFLRDSTFLTNLRDPNWNKNQMWEGFSLNIFFNRPMQCSNNLSKTWVPQILLYMVLGFTLLRLLMLVRWTGHDYLYIPGKLCCWSWFKSG